MKAKQIIRTLGLFAAACLLCAESPGQAAAQQSGILGYWKEPGGAVIQIENCGADVCATLVALSASAPSRVDHKNPEPSLQHRPLCGLRIGNGFHLSSPVKAEGGTLYDPKSGKTYQGTMTGTGDQLNLRGFVGISLFGRTEKWTRTVPVATCQS